jgi:hypothetical protein
MIDRQLTVCGKWVCIISDMLYKQSYFLATQDKTRHFLHYIFYGFHLISWFTISIYMFYCHLYDKFQYIHTFICLLYASINFILYIINFKLSIYLYVLFKSFICFMFYTILYTWSLSFQPRIYIYIYIYMFYIYFILFKICLAHLIW